MRDGMIFYQSATQRFKGYKPEAVPPELTHHYKTMKELIHDTHSNNASTTKNPITCPMLADA